MSGCLIRRQAAADLSYALTHCPRRAAANRARCLHYLVPVKMLRGELTGCTGVGLPDQEAAAADLSYALAHCPRRAAANRARCLHYLVPVKMLLGELPRQDMLARFGLELYAPIVQVPALRVIRRLS